MAQTATIYNFDVELADSDRGRYESLNLRVARHPSESEEYLVTRLLAFLLEFTDGIEFSRGVSAPEDPAIAVRDLTGRITTGSTSARRMPPACTRPANPAPASSSTRTRIRSVSEAAHGEKIHRLGGARALRDGSALVAALAARLDRRVAFSVSITDRELYLSIGTDTLTGASRA